MKISKNIFRQQFAEKVDTLIATQIELLQTKYINEDGLLSRNYPPDNELLYADFNDIYPFLVRLGEQDFAHNQLTRMIGKDVNLHRGLNILQNKYVITSRIDEWLGALFSAYTEFGEPIYEKTISQALDFIFTDLSTHGYLSAYYDIKRKRATKFFSTQSMAVIEVLVENLEIVRLLGYEESFDIWLQNNLNFIFMDGYYKEHGLFKTIVNPGREIFRHSPRNAAKIYQAFSSEKLNIFASMIRNLTNYNFTNLMKSNTNLIFSIIELIKSYEGLRDLKLENVVNDWVHAIKYVDGAAVTFTIGNQQTVDSIISLKQNFPIIDIICDYTEYIGEDAELINIAVGIANYFNSEKAQGIPLANHETMTLHVDAGLDYAVSLLRLSKFTNNKYLVEAADILNNILFNPNIRTENGYYTFYSLETSLGNNLSSKYNGLILKHLIIIKEMIDNSDDVDRVFGNRDILNLIKDR